MASHGPDFYGQKEHSEQELNIIKKLEIQQEQKENSGLGKPSQTKFPLPSLGHLMHSMDYMRWLDTPYPPTKCVGWDSLPFLV